MTVVAPDPMSASRLSPQSLIYPVLAGFETAHLRSARAIRFGRVFHHRDLVATGVPGNFVEE